MYFKAYEILKTNLYAFVNGDIIFDNGLVKTLQVITKQLSSFNTTLISGKRRNYDTNCTTQSLEVWTQDHVHSLTDKSYLAREWCEDYFFVTPDFPWHEIKDVVIARELYDNYLVARSIAMNVTTVDITETITALHQCTTLRDRNAKKIAQENRDYNRILIGKMTESDGYTHKMMLKTMYGWQGDVFVVARYSKTKKTK